MGSRHRHRHKPSIQVTKAYRITCGAKWDLPGNRWDRALVDPHQAMRAARYLKGRGHGKIMRKPTHYASTTVLVRLRASPAVHLDAVRKVRDRGVSIAEIRLDGLTSRSKRKWEWHVGVSCPYCGTCHMLVPANYRGTKSQVCGPCLGRTPIELLAMALL